MKLKLAITTLFFVGLGFLGNAQVRLGVETGAAFTGYNDARIPGEGGDLFSLNKELKGNPFFFYRLNASYTFNKKHSLTLLYAPLQTSYTGRIDRPIYFVNSTFAANTDIEAKYKFNSYRITYRYDFVLNPKIEFGLGLTAKIRDAKVALTSGSLQESSSNVGFVPIINFRLFWHCSDKLGVLFQGDALAAPQGRAEDVLIAANYTLSEQIQLYAGYRLLEGGGDSKSVYSFANFNYASIGFTYTFTGKK